MTKVAFPGSAPRPGSPLPGSPAPAAWRRRRWGLAALAAGAAVLGAGWASPAQAATPVFTVTDRTAIVQVKAHQIGYAQAYCKAGEQAVGGGFTTSALAYRGDLPSLAVQDVYPVLVNRPSTTATAWVTGILNQGDSDTLLVAHVECASTPVGAVVTTRTGPVGASNQFNEYEADCPAGTVVTAGGWDLGRPANLRDFLMVQKSWQAAPGAQGWIVAASDPYWGVKSSTPITSYALCVGDGVTSGPRTASTFRVPSNDSHVQATEGSTLLSCPGGTQLTGVGIVMSGIGPNERSLTDAAPNTTGDPNTWRTTVDGLPTPGIDSPGSVSGGTVTAAPVCVNVPISVTWRPPPAGFHP